MTGYIPRRVKRFILEAHGGVCFYCSAPATSVDHIVPQRAGGTHDLTNLIAACRWCNSRKNGWELPSVRLQKALEAAAAVAPTVRKQEELAVKEGTASRVAALSRAAAARSPNGTALMSVRLGASVKKQLKAMAQEDRRPLASFIALVLAEHVEAVESKTQ